jgi:hypothetical protein
VRPALLALAVSLLALASPARALDQWDAMFDSTLSFTMGVPTEQMGVVFGSIAMVPPSEAVSTLALGLRPLGQANREIILRASENPLLLGRAPDIKTEGARVWVFSGQLPAGRYEIVRARVCVGMTLRDLLPMPRRAKCFEPNGPSPVPLVVNAGSTVYVGRWLMNSVPTAPPDPKLTWMPGFVFMTDAYAEDLPVFEAKRKGGTIPHADGPVENPIPSLLER